MKNQHLQIDDFAPDCYKKDLYEACYSPIIYLVNGEVLWTKSDVVDLQPPSIKRQPGRPKKKRNRKVGEMVRDETHLKRANHGIKYNRCHKEGHNKATSKRPQPVVPPTQVAKGASTQEPQPTVLSQPPQPIVSSQPPQSTVSSQPPTKKKKNFKRAGSMFQVNLDVCCDVCYAL